MRNDARLATVVSFLMIVLFAIFGILLFTQCCGSSESNLDNEVLDESYYKSERSVVMEIHKHGGVQRDSYKYDNGDISNTTYVVMKLENGKSLTFALNKSDELSALLLEKGDTVIYNQLKILDIGWKE